MAWPSAVTLTHLDADTDSVLSARPQIKAIGDAVNSIIASAGTGNGLDADTVDGQHLSSFTPVGRQTLWVSARCFWNTTTDVPPDTGYDRTTPTPDVSYFGYSFDAATDEAVFFTHVFPKAWNKGTLTARFVWTPDSGNAGNVVWGIHGVSIGDGQADETALGTAVLVLDAAGSTDKFIRVTDPTAVITVGGGTPVENELVLFRIYRDADNGSDTYATDAFLHGVILYWTASVGNDA